MLLLQLGLLTLLAFLLTPWALVKYLFVAGFLMALVQRVYLEVLLRCLDFQVDQPEVRTFAREKAPVRIVVKNQAWLSVDLYWTDSTGELEVFGETRKILHIPRRSAMELSYQVRSPYRGLFNLGPSVFRLRDPLGLFSLNLSVPIPRSLLVYPAWGRLKSPGSGVAMGKIRDTWGLQPDPHNLKGLRDFTDGDNLKWLDRGASARLGRQIVRQYTPTLDYPKIYLLDLDLGDYPLRHRYEMADEAVNLVAKGLYTGYEAGYSLGLWIRGGEGNYERAHFLSFGRDHVMGMAESLACSVMGENLPKWGSLNWATGALPRGTTLAYAGPVPKAETQEFLFYWHKKGLRIELLTVTGSMETTKGSGNFFFENRESLRNEG